MMGDARVKPVSARQKKEAARIEKEKCVK